jgi:hypothetical protein
MASFEASEAFDAIAFAVSMAIDPIIGPILGIVRQPLAAKKGTYIRA